MLLIKIASIVTPIKIVKLSPIETIIEVAIV
jgi:hypothetical protein